MDSPAHAEILKWCSLKGWDFERGLIQNVQAISFNEAKTENKQLMLRWRRRICQVCEAEFDIQEHGRFYKCMRCGL